MKLFLTLLTLITLGFAQTSRADDPPKPYPLQTCLISGEKLDVMGEPVVLVYQGQEMKFCCKNCVKKFQADPDQYLKQVQAAEKK